MKSVLPYLEETPYIEKYAWFTTEPLKITSTNKADPLLSNVGGNYILTETGNFYNNWLSALIYLPIGFYFYFNKKEKNA